NDGLADGAEDANADGAIAGDANADRVMDPGETWTETDPLNADTDGDGVDDDADGVPLDPARGEYWTFDLNLTDAQVASLQIGVQANATDAYDAAVDQLTPFGVPSGGGSMVSILLDGSQLITDRRGTYAGAVWFFQATAGGTPLTIQWNSADPIAASLIIRESNADGSAVAGGTVGVMDDFNTVAVPANTTTYFAVGYGAVSFDLTLQPGWNLVSVPLDPRLPDVDSVFQGNQSGDVWKLVNGAYTAATEVEIARGYWVLNNTGATVTVSIPGSLKLQNSFDLNAGWNLAAPVADAPFNPIPVPLTTDPTGAVVGGVFEFDPVTRIYKVATQLESGKGYWIYLGQDAAVALGNY
ncbi:MAG: hypothetical protein GXP31_14115, partial [Kiritimatiellaeota bacterium]|nr:hypothetical protein [Kiritimatiellota bacterium]